MPARSGRVHVATTERHCKGKTYRTHLLRRTFRVGHQVKHETLGNISHLPESLIDIIRRSLAGETFLPATDAFEIQQSLPHGHVQAVLGTIRRLGLDNLIGSKRCRQRDLVVAMIAERLLHPGSKLATTRSWHNTTLAEELAVGDADEDELYDALDWLLARQARIEKKLAEILSPAYPGERLVACYNPLLAQERRRKREELLQATEKELTKIGKQVQRRSKTPLKKAEIALKVGAVRNRFKVGKHFELTIDDGVLRWSRREEAIRREAELDGIYVIRTSEHGASWSADDTVRRYKSLSQVERAFRTLKGIDPRVRPIFHRTEDHVRAHIFLCLLAYYVEWHMRRSLAPLLFDDEQLPEDRKTRDAVAPAKPSAAATRKKQAHQTDDGLPVHSFSTLLAALGTRCRNTCQAISARSSATFQILTAPSPLQTKALQLLRL